jgi:aerobic-type carbon monoxide dehydrogenase small subunit (CoxS/CutS family)
MDVTITLTVNGKKRTLTTDPQRPLVQVLREDFQLTGVKFGCGDGQCGACTVLVDGRRVLSCQTPVGKVDKAAVTTIEGLAEGDKLHPVQEAFVAEGAMQCGYCTPGMILSAVALLSRKPKPTDQEVTDGMNGNLCRCNGYVKIHRAVRRAAGTLNDTPDQSKRPEKPAEVKP